MDEDDRPALSGVALAALNEFLQEQLVRQEEEEKLRLQVDADKPISVESFPEDWNLSQFWYDDATANALGDELIDASRGGPMACISSPSVFVALKKRGVPLPLYVLEYDTRFDVYGQQFVFYDYNTPVALPAELHHSIDAILLDPPFLAEECLSKVVETVRLLARNEETPVILCSGAIMHDTAARLLGARLTQFAPKHAKNLSNEFVCMTNYTSTRFPPKI